jgi:ATP-dependent helicase Lhr and Lhr-like helicase
MQLILHAPFGGRINKAWGLALRKRFCRGFNFELQAAATDNGINIALAEQHSFPLSDVFQFLAEHTVKDLLEQAAIAAPVFKTRWRWAASRSLQLLRMSKGKRVAPQVQRTRSEDLLASVFPQAAACFENIEGDIQIPAHPLVDEVMQDVLQEAMDLAGLQAVLRGIASGSIRCVAVDTPVPSQFAHELLNANPYAFLDEAGLEERRARAVNLRGALPDSVLEGAGRLDPTAIQQVRREIFPDIRDEHELHDLLHSLILLPVTFIELAGTAARHWYEFFTRLQHTGRVQLLDRGALTCWVATERIELAAMLNSSQAPSSEAVMKLVQGWAQITGPMTARVLADMFGLAPSPIYQAFLAMEMQGLLMRGVFEHPATEESHDPEWCERRLLQRIHRLTLSNARRQVEAVSPEIYLRWLPHWQHVAPQSQLSGEEGLLEVLHQLEGFEAPAVEWERTILPARVANYSPIWLDQLCLSGAIGWGRISAHPAWSATDGAVRPRRVIPTNAAPITFYVRETAHWLPHAIAQQCVNRHTIADALSREAVIVLALLENHGACFSADLQRMSGLARQQTAHALWELATAGLAASDGFDQLRALMDPRRRTTAHTEARRPSRSTTGRWSLLLDSSSRVVAGLASETSDSAVSAIQRARETDAALESFARMLLLRYGVLFREHLSRESNAPRWRDLLGILRRLEARGELRGGRFVSGFSGEQFALPEAVDSLRGSRTRDCPEPIEVSAADPLNLAGILTSGERLAAVPGRRVRYVNGQLSKDSAAAESESPGRTSKTPVPRVPSPGGAAATLF